MAWRVGLLYNLKHNGEVNSNAPADALAEFDSTATIEALARALRAGGHCVTLLEADETLPYRIRETRPDICFNIAEGLRGDARESHVPALLEMFAIPYTGSKVLAHAISLDKAAAKHIWRDSGLPTAPFQVLRSGNEPLRTELDFPLFVKPVREGSGMGINERSTVHNEADLREQAHWLLSAYRQPVLVETFLPGREFTVGIIGNRARPTTRQESRLYDARGYHVFSVLEIDVSPAADAGSPYSSHLKSERPLDLAYICPAPIDDALAEEMQQLTVAAFESIDALDVSRVDFRIGSDGRPYLLEINTLPGLNPVYSDIVMAARAAGVEYELLINEILLLAAERYGLVLSDTKKRPTSLIETRVATRPTEQRG